MSLVDDAESFMRRLEDFKALKGVEPELPEEPHPPPGEYGQTDKRGSGGSIDDQGTTGKGSKTATGREGGGGGEVSAGGGRRRAGEEVRDTKAKPDLEAKAKGCPVFFIAVLFNLFLDLTIQSFTGSILAKRRLRFG